MILALEFSTNRRSVAVFETSRDPINPPQLLAAGDEEVQRGISPFGLLDRLLNQARITPSQVEQIIVGIGPGSYTGIRSSLAIAKGWQLANPVILRGVATPDILAKQIQASGVVGRVHTLIDAQRGEVYSASYLVSNQEILPLGPIGLGTPNQLLIQEGDIIIGPGADRWFPEARSIFPEAAFIPLLAHDKPHTLKSGEIEPIYLRQTTFQKAPLPRVLPVDLG